MNNFFINQTKEITPLLLTISTYNFKQTVEKYIHKTTTKTKNRSGYRATSGWI